MQIRWRRPRRNSPPSLEPDSKKAEGAAIRLALRFLLASIANGRYCRYGHLLPKLSNSPFRTPPRNACHSSGVNWRTSPSESLLLRTPTPPLDRLATSTQLPLAKLRELLTQ